MSEASFVVVQVIAGILLVNILLCNTYRGRYNQHPLPPGPTKLPVVGNLFQMPKERFIWRDYAAMSRTFNSDILHFNGFGNSIVILNSAKAINDLLDQRSSIYSGRPRSIMLGELIGWKTATPFRSSDNAWKARRKTMNQALNVDNAKQFYSQQLSATHKLLKALPDSDDVMSTLYLWAAVFIMDVTYGINREETEHYMHIALEGLYSMGICGTPGAFYVDLIPVLKYVPQWFPGAAFQRKAKEWGGIRTKMTESTFSAVKDRMAKGIAYPSFCKAALEQMDIKKDQTIQEENIKLTSVSLYAGGTETTAITIGDFILAMLLNPDVQTQAQKQLDNVLGPGTLPCFDDEASLPYITAIIKEVIRHDLVVPLAFPHVLTQDDVYEGYFLPKDSLVLGNAWAILHDENEYPDPEKFDPSRFLDVNGNIDPQVKDPLTVAFGYGRRVCPGKHIALPSLFIAAASILACYRIESEIDEQGNSVQPKAEWYSGPSITHRPLSFKCRFISRSTEVEASLQHLGS